MNHLPRTRRVAIAIVVLLVAGFAAVLRVKPGGSFVGLAVDDLGEAVAAGIAAVPCAWRAARSRDRTRLSWALMGAALTAWSAGEFVWSYVELVSRRDLPFPSIADVGFLLFPAFALAGLLVRPSAALTARGRLRLVLDGAIVASALFLVSWATSLGAVYRAGAENGLAMGISLAYPAGDLVLLTVVVLIVSRSRLQPGLAVLAGGLAAMAVADSAFAYLNAAGTYGTGGLSDVGWVTAFLMIGLSALFPDEDAAAAEDRVESPLTLALPYLLVTIGVIAEGIGLARHTTGPLTRSVAAVTFAVVLARQVLVVLDNRRLATDVLAQREELSHRAFHDPLTGLANRALFQDRVAHALDLHQRDQRPVSVMFVDLDDFKAINDSYGHDVGDQLLVAVAQRLAGVVRTGDTIARFGGDEFAVLLEDDGDAAVLAERILVRLAAPVNLGDHFIPIQASIGVTTLETDRAAIEVRELLRRADAAMYAAKRSGKARSVCFSDSLRSVDGADLDVRTALARDVAAGRILAATQAIHGTDGRLYGHEVLARWRHSGKVHPAAMFVPLARRSGLLAELDLLVAQQALRFASETVAADNVMVAVNVGLTRLRESDLPARLAELVSRYAVAPGALVVEIAEQETTDETGARAAIAALREAGVGVAIDDFGVGYSNLSRLGALRPDIVKLDRSFVEPLAEPGAPTRLLAGVIDIAHDLGAFVVGEGVEHERQFEVLRDLGCDAVQGFLFGQPQLLADDALLLARPA